MGIALIVLGVLVAMIPLRWANKVFGVADGIAGEKNHHR
jgi:hypothetical protein